MNVQLKPMGAQPQLSIESFFQWIDTQDDKYELVDGIARLQPWVKRSHSRIAGNIAHLLRTGLDHNLFDIHQGDFAIETGPKSVRYADVLVEPAGTANDDRMAKGALLVVEVLSDSTASVDFGPKLLEYAGIETIQDYLIVSQDKRCVWQWTRGADGVWPDSPLISMDEATDVVVLGMALAFDEIYRGVFPAQTAPDR